jgi:protease I
MLFSMDYFLFLTHQDYIINMENTEILKDRSVAIITTDGFEEIELTAPLKELRGCGATVHIVSDKPKIKSWKNKRWGNQFDADRLFDNVNINEYDALILPGGVINADRLRRNNQSIHIIQDFHKKIN